MATLTQTETALDHSILVDTPTNSVTRQEKKWHSTYQPVQVVMLWK